MRGKWLPIFIIPVVLGIPLVFTQGQDRLPPPLPASTKPASIPSLPAKPLPSVGNGRRDLSRLSLPERQAFLSGQRGMEWLQRANRMDGRFIYGYLPALRTPMEGDHYLSQAKAAWILARAARFYGDDKGIARARQSVLTLKMETTTDTANDLGYTNLPPLLVNRLAACGFLILAIHELPSPAKDLLEPSRQLCNFLRRQQQPDGSLRLSEETLKGNEEAEGIAHFAGPALYALASSHKLQPAPWKMDLLAKARGFYVPWWRGHKNMAMIPWHTAAYAEAYLATRDPAHAEAVFEMNDWLCERQYQQLNPRRPLWLGGFKNWSEGKETAEAPEIGSAAYAGSLAQACRVARLAGDVRRLERYRQAVERGVQFLSTLQYTDANTQHFADWYRPALVGAFHASHQDGNLRLDYDSDGVAALLAYLEQAGEGGN